MNRTVWATTLGLAMSLASAATATAAGGAPTFSKDVAPILFTKCVSCHRPGEVAPMSLMTYEQVRPWAKALKNKVVAREMPPWGADPRYGKFVNDGSLTSQQIEIISAWVDGGAPKGNEADMPPLPTFSAGWTYGEPEFVIEMMAPYHIPPEGEMPNLSFYSPIPFKEDRF